MSMRVSHRQARRQGFTIIELLIVVIVIGILAAAGIGKYQSFAEKARSKTCMSNQTEIGNAFAVYFTQYRSIPTDNNGWMAISNLGYTRVYQGSYPNNGWDDGSIRNIMKDSKGFYCPGSMAYYYGGDYNKVPANNYGTRRWGYNHTYKGQDTGASAWPRANWGDNPFPYSHEFVFCTEWGVPGDTGPDGSANNRHSARW